LLVVRRTFHSHKSHRNGLFSFLFWEYILYLHENYQALLPPILARATHLRTVHIQIVNRPLELVCRALGHALDILRRCSPTISQVGIDTNVWKAGLLLVTVTRSLIIDPGGKMYIDSEGYSGVEAVSHHSREPGYTRTTPRSSRVEKKRMVVFLCTTLSASDVRCSSPALSIHVAQFRCSRTCAYLLGRRNHYHTDRQLIPHGQTEIVAPGPTPARHHLSRTHHGRDIWFAESSPASRRCCSRIHS